MCVYFKFVFRFAVVVIFFLLGLEYFEMNTIDYFFFFYFFCKMSWCKIALLGFSVRFGMAEVPVCFFFLCLDFLFSLI